MQESEVLELKKTTAPIREIVETICAFSNHHGGELYIGVSDSGKVLGVEATDDTVKRLANEIKLATEPKLFPQIELVLIEGKHCLRLSIEESPLKPHLAFGRPFLRVGTTNQRIDQQTYEYLLHQRQNGYGFDYLFCETASLSDIDTDTLISFAESANAKRFANIDLYSSTAEILEKLDLTKKDKLTNAAILLFGKRPQSFFEFRYEVKLGVFADDIGYNPILDEKVYTGNLINIQGSLLSAILLQLNKSVRIVADSSNEEYEYPLEVIREAVVNMIVHRDYRQSVKSTVEIRPGSVTFYNPAQLFTPTITIENLHRHHPSRPGNRMIAKVFYLMGLFENWGSGTNKIINLSKSAGKHQPLFSYQDGMFKLILHR